MLRSSAVYLSTYLATTYIEGKRAAVSSLLSLDEWYAQNTRKLACKGMPDVEFIEMPESFRVNLYRSSLPMDSIGETSVEHRQKNGVATVDTPFNLELNSTQIKIIELLSANSNMTGVDLSEAIGISKRNIEVNLKKLKEKGVLVRHGSSKGGYWEVKAHE